MEEYKQQYYHEGQHIAANGHQPPLFLFDEDVYKPQNCRGTVQKLLVGIALMQMKEIKEYEANGGEAPASILTYVQGNPGT